MTIESDVGEVASRADADAEMTISKRTTRNERKVW